MSLEQYREEDFEQMRRMEQAVHAALLPFAEHTDPILAVLALMRCVQLMLRAAKTQAREQLVPVLVAFLQGRRGRGTASDLIWMPDREVH